MDGLLAVIGEFIPLTGLALASVGCSDDLMTACIMSSLTSRKLAPRTNISPPVGVARLAVVFIALPGARPVVANGVTSTVVYLGILHGLCASFPALVSPLQRASTR